MTLIIRLVLYCTYGEVACVECSKGTPGEVNSVRGGEHTNPAVRRGQSLWAGAGKSSSSTFQEYF